MGYVIMTLMNGNGSFMPQPENVFRVYFVYFKASAHPLRMATMD
jgi:hypothetical protein